MKRRALIILLTAFLGIFVCSGCEVDDMEKPDDGRQTSQTGGGDINTTTDKNGGNGNETGTDGKNGGEGGNDTENQKQGAVSLKDLNIISKKGDADYFTPVTDSYIYKLGYENRDDDSVYQEAYLFSFDGSGRLIQYVKKEINPYFLTEDFSPDNYTSNYLYFEDGTMYYNYLSDNYTEYKYDIILNLLRDRDEYPYYLSKPLSSEETALKNIFTAGDFPELGAINMPTNDYKVERYQDKYGYNEYIDSEGTKWYGESKYSNTYVTCYDGNGRVTKRYTLQIFDEESMILEYYKAARGAENAQSAMEKANIVGNIVVSESRPSVGSFKSCADINIEREANEYRTQIYFSIPYLTEKQIENDPKLNGGRNEDFEYLGDGDGGIMITYCSNITGETVIPEKINGKAVTIIGGGIFNYNEEIKKVTIPDSVKVIAPYAFSYCKNLKEVKFGGGLEEIMDSAFSYCENLVEIKLPDSVKLIGMEAFYGCKEATVLTIPKGLTEIGYGAFNSCVKLAEVTIPDGVKTIGEYAFAKCESLNNITIPGSVTAIGNFAFLDCKGFTDITVPGSVKTFGSGIFSGCDKLAKVTLPGGLTEITDYMFKNCKSLAAVAIPDSVKVIGREAFYECESLTNVKIPDGVTVIKDSTFERCSAFTEIKIPDSVTVIESYAFCACSNLVSITIPNGVTAIGSAAFRSCENLKKAAIPVTVTSIGYEAFSGCRVLEGITIPNGVKTIGGSAFQGCNTIVNITVPDSVTKVGSSVFYDCANLKGVTYKGKTYDADHLGDFNRAVNGGY